jgi:hypothetical protein
MDDFVRQVLVLVLIEVVCSYVDSEFVEEKY